MTRLLEKAFKKASKLPETEQNAIAKWLLEELESEQEWEKRFADTEDILDRLADEALEAHGKGKTKEMDFNRL
jgi:mRNA-degrading endonuclease RelE of RelBE toxin-antitoxin system